MWKKAVSYILESKSEMKKVNWPTRKQVIDYTVTVIVLSVAAAVFLGSLDMMFGKLIKMYVVG